MQIRKAWWTPRREREREWDSMASKLTILPSSSSDLLASFKVQTNGTKILIIYVYNGKRKKERKSKREMGKMKERMKNSRKGWEKLRVHYSLKIQVERFDRLVGYSFLSVVDWNEEDDGWICERATMRPWKYMSLSELIWMCDSLTRIERKRIPIRVLATGIY